MFTRNNSSQRIKNRFTWFQKWILERQTFKTLSRDSGLSIDTLQRIFSAFLRQSPTVRILKRSRVYLRLDATYFEQFCMLCYQDNEDGYTQLIRFSDGEHFGEIKEDLDNLIKLGVQIESITTDGHKSILKAIKKSLPQVVVQRCLVHIQRMCLLWLTRFPKHIAGVELRRLVLLLLRIKTQNDRLHWSRQLEQWHQQHKVYLQEKTINEQTGRYWYKHKLLRRSYLTIKRALPNMFHYLANPAIPKTTNGIEGFFSHLKNHLDLHRGLTLQHRIDFIKWYVYLSNDK
jgi:AraC-like DNA-binding protein